MIRLSLLLIVLVGTAFGQLQYTVSGTGVPVLKVHGKEILKTQMIFWGAKWRWAGVTVRKTEAPQTWSLASDALHLAGSLAWAVEPGKMVATYSFDVAEATPEAIGGGLEFRPAYEDGVFGGQGKPPELLDKQGWQWEMSPGQILRVTAEPGFANVYFERGNRGVIRCMFYADEIPAGKRTVKLSFALPKGGTRVRSLDERYGDPDTSTWFRNALAPTASFVDLSHLNHKPAGKHGFVQAKGEDLVLGDGTPIRFWGCNVQAYSLFIKDRELIKAHARRIAQLGFNLVRLHHHDSRRWVNPCLIQDGPTTQELNPAALDTYFYWVKCLRDEGIYVWVDLHVGRPFKPGDEIPDFAEVDKKKHETGAEFKGYCYVNQRVTELMQEFNRKLLTATNPHTGRALKDDPAIMGLLVTNENDLTHHFGNGLLGDKGVPAHNRLFVAAAEAFAAKTGLDANALQKTWLPGPAKLLLNDMEYRWSQGMVGQLRQLGARVPVATGHMWGGNPHFSLPALTAGELVDVHTYERGEFLVRNPLYEGDFAQYIAACQVLGRPLTVTEWNAEDNARPRDPFTEPLYLAAVAAFQGWDAPMLYGYSQDALRGGKVSAWSSHNHPGIIGLMPAAALLFRRGDVSLARPGDWQSPAGIAPRSPLAAPCRHGPSRHQRTALAPGHGHPRWSRSGDRSGPGRTRRRGHVLDQRHRRTQAGLAARGVHSQHPPFAGRGGLARRSGGHRAGRLHDPGEEPKGRRDPLVSRRQAVARVQPHSGQCRRPGGCPDGKAAAVPPFRARGRHGRRALPAWSHAIGPAGRGRHPHGGGSRTGTDIHASH